MAAGKHAHRERVARFFQQQPHAQFRPAWNAQPAWGVQRIDEAGAFHVLDSLQVLSLSTNLGDTKTLCAHPASTSHGRLTEAQRQAAGIGQGLVRVAVGLEHFDDVTADLQRGLSSY